MPSIFLCHNSIDKPFVTGLAQDLRKLGVNVWYDKWEIKVGDSILWKIEEGIRENEFLCIVLSPEALDSEWVKTELGAGMAKQMEKKKVHVLPLLLRDCDIPLVLRDKKYADFRSDYQQGMRELAEALGIKQTETLSEENWRWFARNVKQSNWKEFREKEYSKLVTRVVDLADQYNWSVYTGGTKLPFSLMVEAFVERGIRKAVTVRLDGRTYSYMAHDQDAWNPNHLKAKDLKLYVGNTIEECNEYLWRHMEDFQKKHGNPPEKGKHFVHRYMNFEERNETIENVLKTMSWYKGDSKL